jgi:hypothetical protein
VIVYFGQFWGKKLAMIFGLLFPWFKWRINFGKNALFSCAISSQTLLVTLLVDLKGYIIHP